jgi:hypothetical protein
MNFANIRNAFLVLIVGALSLYGANPTEVRHEIGRFVVIDPATNMADVDIHTPPGYDRLATTEPGFFVRVECKGENWNIPEEREFSIAVQWSVYGADGSLQGPSDQRLAHGRCYQQDRDTVVDLTPVMPRSSLARARTSVWLWPPTPDSSGQPRVIRWTAVGMNYEADMPEPVMGPAGPQGPEGKQGLQGPPGIDGQPGRDGQPGVCDCPESECDAKQCKNPKHKHYKVKK